MSAAPTDRHRVAVCHRSAGGDTVTLGHAVKVRALWRFEPAIPGRRPGREATREIGACIPRWIGSIERTELRAGAWTISYDPPPIPTRECDWRFVHDDYDAEQFSDGSVSDNGLSGHGATADSCLDQIAEFEASEREDAA